jgi:hypothetical protein
MSEGILPPPKEPPSLFGVITHVALAWLWIGFLTDPAKALGATTISLTLHYAVNRWFELKGPPSALARGVAALIALWGVSRGEGWCAGLVAVIGIIGVFLVPSKSDS